VGATPDVVLVFHLVAASLQQTGSTAAATGYLSTASSRRCAACRRSGGPGSHRSRR